MDIEFHYYMTYLVAAKAGMGPDDALTIAHAAQYVDNNDVRFEINKGRGTAYRNYISQTMDILKPKAKLFRIYPIFHFIPGDPKSKTAWRKDGKMHWLNTTPNSKNANKIIDQAISSGDLYRIGIAAHGYADTWAHQNFVGYYDDMNSMDMTLAAITPNIGHADARHDPDWPALVWRDTRLIEEQVDNRSRFLEAARHLLAKLARFADKSISDQEIKQRQDSLTNDLNEAIGDPDQSNERRSERVDRYKRLAQKAEYGDRELPEYNEDDWFDDAVNEHVRGLRDRSEGSLLRLDPLIDTYTWKDDQAYQLTEWYKFQQAVKVHQNESWEFLAASNLRGLELRDL
jgi:hypothetical protein